MVVAWGFHCLLSDLWRSQAGQIVNCKSCISLLVLSCPWNTSALAKVDLSLLYPSLCHPPHPAPFSKHTIKKAAMLQALTCTDLW